ncbi:astacin [Ancylostoma duodenale]|uniref:Metalloendopeptidase n=1 Tax=Ancylostoma duodenale TaxID=51022 RepID=A0A0C2GXH3_9BILA|nr:astacin [Ancylostoma duodenale]
MEVKPFAILLAICMSRAAVGGNTELGSRLVVPKLQKQKKEGRVNSKVIYYYYDNGIDRDLKHLFEEAIKAWKDYTCIGFKKVKYEKSAILVENTGPYCSHSGKPGQEQWLNIGCGDFTGVAHEVGHALGLEHTHSRPDRDQYLTVNWTNVETFRAQYEKKAGNTTDYRGILYDYGSIMH